MRKIFALVLLLCCALSVSAKTALDLMLEGRYTDAKKILETTNSSPRYQLMYYALTESEAARACSLYQVVAIRYSNTDCDSVARLRLQLAREAGAVIMPIAEWANAPASVKPLYLRRMSTPASVENPRTVADVKPVAPPPVAKDTLKTAPVAAIAKPDTMAAKNVIASPNNITEKTLTLTIPAATFDSAKAKSTVESKPVMDTVAKVLAVAPQTPPKAIPAPLEPAKPVAPPVKEPVVAKVDIPIVAKPLPVNEPKAETPIASAKPTTPLVGTKTEPLRTEAKKEPTEKPLTPSMVAKPEIAKVEPKTEPVKIADVTPKKSAEKPSTPQATHDKPNMLSGKWFIQVGAFGNFDNAHRLAATLQKAGYPIKLVPRELKDKKLLQVRVGGYDSKDACQPIEQDLKSKFSVPTVVISE